MSSRSEYGWKIVRLCEKIMSRMIPNVRDYNHIEDYVDMFFLQRFLKNISGRGEFDFG